MKILFSSGNLATATELNLKNVMEDDMNDLFMWRNHPDVRKYSFNPNPISWSEHEEWFMKKIRDPDTTMYIAYYGKEKIGTIRYEDTHKEVQVSIMLNPDFFGRGLGSKIITLGTKKFIRERNPDKPIFAKIKSDNIASIKAFQKAGFRENHITYVFKR